MKSDEVKPTTQPAWYDFRFMRLIMIIAIPVVIILLFTSLVYSLSPVGSQQFVGQAGFLLEGHIAVDTETFGTFDSSYSEFTGEYYWPLGIMPSIVLMPVVALFDLFRQSELVTQTILSFPITLAVLYLSYKIAIKHRFRKLDSLFLALAFTFGSVFCLPVFLPRSWYFAHELAVFFLMFAVYEYFHQRRYWVIGIMMAVLMQTRYISALCAGFFVLDLFINKTDKRFKKFTYLIVPMVVSGLILLYLNYIRFGNIFDTGYTYAEVGQEFLITARDKYGYFNLASVPRNFYYYFIAFLKPVTEPITQHFVWPYFEVDLAGFGFFFVSPIFAKILINFKLTKNTIAAWIVSLGILMILLTHYTTGYVTYGPRYMMDFLPLLYILLLQSFPGNKLKPFHYIVIIISSFINMYLVGFLFGY